MHKCIILVSFIKFAKYLCLNCWDYFKHYQSLNHAIRYYCHHLAQIHCKVRNYTWDYPHAKMFWLNIYGLILILLIVCFFFYCSLMFCVRCRESHLLRKLYFRHLYTDYQELATYLTIFIQTNRTIWGGVGRLQAKLDKQMVLIIWEFSKSIHDILRHIPSIHHHHLGYMGTFWEQQAHWLFTLLLKVSGLLVLLSILIRWYRDTIPAYYSKVQGCLQFQCSWIYQNTYH